MKPLLAIATHKKREKFLKQSLESLLRSNTPADIHVYLNDYEEVPKWLKKLPITSILGKDAGGDFGASAKFYWGDKHDGIYITADDDLIYDKRYVGYLADMVYRYNQLAIVGLHGTNYKKFPVKSYYSDPGRQIFYCYHQLGLDRSVDMLGTGCLAFDTRYVKVSIKDFPEKRMTDPYLFKFAKENDVPLVCLSREPGFVYEMKGSQDSAIWKSVAKNDSKQTKVINSAKSPKRHLGKRIADSDFGDASIEYLSYKEILNCVEPGSKFVEFGTGSTTKYLKDKFDLVSVENDQKYLKEGMTHAPIKDGWYSGLTKKDIKTGVKAYLIDGPKGKLRSGILDNLDLLNQSAVFFVDDTNRPDDRKVAEKIADEFGKEIVEVKGKEKNFIILK